MEGFTRHSSKFTELLDELLDALVGDPEQLAGISQSLADILDECFGCLFHDLSSSFSFARHLAPCCSGGVEDCAAGV